MDTNQIPSDEPRTPATNKKPYEKPSFRFEQVFVTTALTCGKISSHEHGCHFVQKS
jgi:hypothetical protein